MANMLRGIPSVTELLAKPPLKGMVDTLSHNAVVDGIREFLGKMREELRERTPDNLPQVGELAEKIADWLHGKQRSGLRPVINATGVLLHTGLGRAPLAKSACDAMQKVAQGYANLEVDLESGKRSHRLDFISKQLAKLTGADAALVVNNNAGATVVVLSALAAGREVIVSRGQLVEIGGSFRLPDVMQACGATLHDVGTTNKTRIDDYEQAINERTGALLRVHTSNFRVVGFTDQPSLAELVALARRSELPLIDDIGSGALIDFARYGFPEEPVAAKSLKAGADLVLFSGDKLMGGPQCGIIAGRKSWIDKIKTHPLMRALRVDKMTLAALSSTLDLYVDPAQAEQEIPLLAALSTSVENLKLRADRLSLQMDALPHFHAEPMQGIAYLGGGSMPDQQLPTWAVKISHDKIKVDRLTQMLRTGEPSVFGRIQNDHLMLDLRSVPPSDDATLVTCLQALNDGE